MSYSFDLTQERWVPCVMPDGSSEELSLRDALVRAHEIREVLDASPLVTVCLHRLMLAILHRVFGPADPDEWAEMWEAGQFDERDLTDYLDQWRHCFDLFDDERPFYQTAGMPAVWLKSITTLAQHLASGNNDTLFDHSLDEEPVAVTPARAARLLLATHSFNVDSIASGEGSKGKTYPKAAPLAGGAIVMATGHDLFETLMLNLLLYSPDNELPFAVLDEDMPAWEQETAAAPETLVPRGYLDYLTWQSRRVWLEPSEGLDEEPVVKRIILSQGRQFPDGSAPQDPMIAYARRTQAKPNQQALLPVKLRQYRAFWRDSAVLFQSVPDQRQRPRIMDWLADLVDEYGVFPPEMTYAISVAGLCSHQAKVHFWRHERQPVPLSYLTDAELVGDLRRALELAEEAGATLRRVLWLLAGIIAAPEEERSAASDVISSMVDGYPALPTYWAELETRFSELLLRLPGDMAHRTEVLRWWANECVARTAMDAFEQTTRGFPQTPRFLRAIVVAEGRLRRQVYGEVIKVYRYEEVKHAQAE